MAVGTEPVRAWRERTFILLGKRVSHVMTNAEHLGGNVNDWIDDATGAVTRKETPNPTSLCAEPPKRTYIHFTAAASAESVVLVPLDPTSGASTPELTSRRFHREGH